MEEIDLGEVDFKLLKDTFEDFYLQVSKVIVGQEKVVKGILRAILCDGHVLVEGVPGIAKTALLKTIALLLGCDSKRVQFTVDLLPTDITGLTTYTPEKGFEFIKGPVFTNFLLADEINRGPPKTQSAMLEAMQEKTVTISKVTHILPKPFFVMATQNPLENSGVYPLPEAQVDRFLFKILMNYPTFDEEKKILSQNITLKTFESYNLSPLLTPEKIIELQKLVLNVRSSPAIKQYIVEIVEKTRQKNLNFSKYISYGASPRASIALFVASKAEALLNGRNFVIPEDVKNVVHEVLRHRIILSYTAEAEKKSQDNIIDEILKLVEVP